ncbi:MAG: DUF4331 family protein [bacterium]
MPSRRMKTGVALAFLLAAGATLGPSAVLASSHREAPLISNDPVADNTDTYFFVSPENDGAVTLVGCWWPLEEASGGPNWFHFADNVAYDFNVDSNGDARPDITFRFRFQTRIYNEATFLYATGPLSSLDDTDWNYRQTYSLTRIDHGRGSTEIAKDLVVPPVNIGPRTTPDYENLVKPAFYSLPNGYKTFAGQRDDPFFVDLGAVFDLLGFRAIPGNVGEGVDGLSGFNCQAIVLELPIEAISFNGSNPTDPADPFAVIGMWSSTSRSNSPVLLDGGSAPRGAETFTQVSRLGMPLVNEVVIPLGKKDLFNRSRPFGDAQFLSHVTDPELATIIESIYGITKPPAPRCDLVAAFLTGVPGLNSPPNVVPGEMIRLNVAIKPDDVFDRFGVLAGDLDGFPNGRRLIDDVVDIEERVVAGVLYPVFCDPNFVPHPLASQLGDGVDKNDLPFLDEFPYLATPTQGWEIEHGRIEPAHPPQRTVPSSEVGRVLKTSSADAPSEAAVGTARFELGLSRPNPTSAATQIAFNLAKESAVSLRVFDVSGREVKQVVDARLPAGSHSARWDGTDAEGRTVASGVYVYRLETPGERAERKLTVMK